MNVDFHDDVGHCQPLQDLHSLAFSLKYTRGWWSLEVLGIINYTNNSISFLITANRYSIFFVNLIFSLFVRDHYIAEVFKRVIMSK